MHIGQTSLMNAALACNVNQNLVVGFCMSVFPAGSPCYLSDNFKSYVAFCLLTPCWSPGDKILKIIHIHRLVRCVAQH